MKDFKFYQKKFFKIYLLYLSISLCIFFMSYFQLGKIYSSDKSHFENYHSIDNGSFKDYQQELRTVIEIYLINGHDFYESKQYFWPFINTDNWFSNELDNSWSPYGANSIELHFMVYLVVMIILNLLFM